MGAWGFRFDENDAAADWLAAFAEAPGWPIVKDALHIDQASYVEIDEGCCAVAAAEIIAAANGHAAPSLDPALRNWATAVANVAEGRRLTGLAAGIIQYLNHHGELADLWQEGDATPWLAEMGDLQKRLTS